MVKEGKQMAYRSESRLYCDDELLLPAVGVAPKSSRPIPHLASAVTLPGKSHQNELATEGSV
jgi:hypothetical protein